MGRQATSDIDRLIEMGLNRYGAGDLDGALLLWEEALAIDPENAQASSYVDYVRLNYELLTGEPSVEDDSGSPYAIEEEPEYQIEIVPGTTDLPALEAVTGAPLLLDPVDDGWFVEEETHDTKAVEEAESQTFELEADEPPDDVAPPPEHNFDAGDTREYYGDIQRSSAPIVPRPEDLNLDEGTAGPTMGFFRPDEKTGGSTQGYFRGDESTEYGESDEDPAEGFRNEDATGSFKPEGTPVGFANLETEIRKRNFGFVQPVADPGGPSESAPLHSRPEGLSESAPLHSRPGGPSESAPLHSRPGARNEYAPVHRGPAAAPKPVKDEPSSPLSIGVAPTQDLIAFDATQERGPFLGRAPTESADQSADDLLDSLPTPRPARAEPESGEFALPATATLDFPDSARQPAGRDLAAVSQAEIMLAHVATRELSPNDVRALAHNPVVSAPTRELGLRPGGRPAAERPELDPMGGEDDDAPTGQSDVRAIREAAARNDGALDMRSEGTRHDIVLPFDPITAASAQIIDAVDTEAPDGESQDDKTRRRITRLLEKAGDWNDAGELDKAVAAVDLALSEDPNSALAQKLITRNKDTIMSLFQAFLGDLDRTPALAKPLHELASAPISPRAAFLLSRIDGMITIDELLDVSGMPRLEAYRHLCQLFLRGILR